MKEEALNDLLNTMSTHRRIELIEGRLRKIETEIEQIKKMLTLE